MIMIEEQFVSFDTAKMLREAGFDVPCTSQYTEGMGVWNVEYPYDFNKDDFGYSRPTQALAARWLREVHKLHVWCETTPYGDWFCCISKIKPYEEYAVVSEAEYSSFEQAFETGLREAVKLIKK